MPKYDIIGLALLYIVIHIFTARKRLFLAAYKAVNIIICYMISGQVRIPCPVIFINTFEQYLCPAFLFRFVFIFRELSDTDNETKQ